MFTRSLQLISMLLVSLSSTAFSFRLAKPVRETTLDLSLQKLQLPVSEGNITPLPLLSEKSVPSWELTFSQSSKKMLQVAKAVRVVDKIHFSSARVFVSSARVWHYFYCLTLDRIQSRTRTLNSGRTSRSTAGIPGKWAARSIRRKVVRRSTPD